MQSEEKVGPTRSNHLLPGVNRSDMVGAPGQRIGMVALVVVVTIVAVAGLLAAAGTASAANGTTAIHNCTVIDEPGTYEFEGNITDINGSRMSGSGDYQDACIDIRASDVVLDGNGSLLDADETDQASFSERRGIHVNGTYGGRQNVTIRNVVLTDWPRGVRTHNAGDVLVEDVTVRTRDEGDTRGWIGINPRGTADSTFRRNTIEAYATSIQSEGLRFAPNRNNRYADNVVRGIGNFNIGTGSDGVAVVGNELRYDYEIGTFTNFVTIDNGTVSDNLIVGNGTLAIEGSNLAVERNTVRNASNAGDYGIDIEGDGFAVRNNTVANSTRGLQIKGSDHVLRDNVLRDNAENVHLVRRYTDLRTTRYSDLVSLDVDTSNTADGDPIYVFQEESDVTFASEDVGYLAYVNSSGITVRDVTLTNNTDGLFLANVTDSTIEDNTLRENAHGIEMSGGDNLTIRRNDIADNTQDGAVGFPARTGPSNVTVASNTVTGNEVYGVELRGRDLTIADNHVSNNGEGIDVTGERATIRTSDVSDNRGRGIRATADNVTVRNNRVAGNGGEGVFFDYNRDNEYAAIGNNVSNNGGTGILTESVDGRLLDNTLLGNGESGIHVRSRGSAVVRNNTARDNRYGVRLYHYESGLFDPELPVDDNVVADNVLTDNTRGVDVGTGSSNNTIRDNVVVGNTIGIALDDVGDGRIVRNNVSENGDGIHVARAGNVTIADNGRLTGNEHTAITVVDTDRAAIRNHTATGNGGGLTSLSSAVTVTNLTADDNDGDGIRIREPSGLDLGPDVSATGNAGHGLSIEDASDVRIRGVGVDDNGEAGLRLADVTDATVRDVSANDNEVYGVAIVPIVPANTDFLTPDTNITVSNVTAKRAGTGVYILYESGVTVENSTVTGANASRPGVSAGSRLSSDPAKTIRGAGIVANGANDTHLRGNMITNNDGPGVVLAGLAGDSRVARNDVTDNGGFGIEFIAHELDDFAARERKETTVARNDITDNGRRGVSLEYSSRVAIRNNTIARNTDLGILMNGPGNNNTIERNEITAHTNENGTAHGVVIIGTVDGFPVDTAVLDNTITDNDVAVSLIEEGGNTVRGNDVLRNDVGIRFGASTIPTSVDASYECSNGNPGTKASYLPGSGGNVLADNHIEGGTVGLQPITHPTRIIWCENSEIRFAPTIPVVPFVYSVSLDVTHELGDGGVESVYSRSPSVSSYSVTNNYISAEEPVNVTSFYGTQFNGTNAWNVSKTGGGNLLGGPYRGGNYWATPNGTGLSQTCADADGDGICDSARTIATNNVDRLPLAADQPAFFDIAIDATTSPAVSGDQIDVTTTITNTGNATATETIDLTVDGTVAGSVSRTLAPGESTTETFTWDTGGVPAGKYSATVASGVGSASVPLTINPNVSVRINATNAPITETEALTVDATLRNNRENPVTETIELLDFDGTVVDSREVSLGAGESASISLSWATAIGDHATGDVTVRSENDVATATATVRNGSITDCTYITRPGRYRIESNLTFGGNSDCIVIESSGVSIDGQGHDVAGTGDGIGVLVDVGEGAATDVSLNDLTIRDASYAVRVPVPDQESVSGISLTGITTESISDDAFYSGIGKNGSVAGLSVHDSTLAADDDGIVLDADDVDVAVRDVTVTGTTLNTGDIGVELYLDYDRTTLDGFELANSTIEAAGEAVDLDASDADTTIRTLRIADSTLNASDTALIFDYAGDDAAFESARVADNHVRSDSGSGISLVGAEDRTITRDVSIEGNDVRGSGYAVRLEHDYDDLTVERLSVAANEFETDGGSGVFLEADDTAVTVAETSIRNNTIASGSVGVELELAGGFDATAVYETVVVGNEIRGFDDTGIELDGVLMNATTDVVFRGNTVHNVSGIVTGIEVETEDGVYPEQGTLAVRNNSVRTGGDAVRIRSPSGRVDMIDISYNALVAPGFGVTNEASDSTAPVNATMNYWAASDGPGSAGPYEDPVTGALADGNGSAVSNGSSVSVANVRFDPFLAADPIESGDSGGTATLAVRIDATNTPVEESGTLTVDATVENTGSVEGSQSVILSVGGIERDSTAVALASGESTTVTLSWTTGSGDAGEYAATIATDDATDSTAVTVTAPVTLPPSVQPVDACTNVTASGHYALTDDLSGSGTCIEIEADDVVINGNGHVIEGVDADNASGIRAGYRSAGANVTVRNVTVRGWTTGVDFRGIDVGRVADVGAVDNGVGIRVGTAQVNVNPLDPRRMILTSSNVELRGNAVEHNNRTGIVLDRATNFTVADNRITDNNESGLVLLASKRNDVANNTLAGNGDVGLEITGRSITIRERETATRLGEPVPDPDSNNNAVWHNAVTNNEHGMLLRSTPNGSVVDNAVTGNDDIGIFVTGGPILGPTSNLSVANNTVTANNGSGIVLFGPSSVPVYDNTVTNNTAMANNGSGIVVLGAEENLIRDNRVAANNGSGVSLLSGPADNELRNNTAARNDRFGVALFGSVNTEIVDNAAIRNGRDGFFVQAPGETLAGNNATANGRSGFAIRVDDVTLSGVTANANGRDGILVRAPNVTVRDSAASGNDRNGIHLRSSARGEITDSVASGNGRHGILLNFSATDNELTGNTANGNVESGFALSGIRTAVPDDNSLTDSVARNNGAWALTIRNASGTVVDALDVGASTEPETTLSFEGENVAVGASAAPPANPDNESVGRYFDAEATGDGAFLDVELHYTDGDVGGLDEESLALRRYDGTEWTAIDSTPNTAENVVAANVTDFSTFGAFGAESNGSDDRETTDGETGDDDSGGGPTIAPGQPGFGPVVALIALLLALATAAVRRRGA